LHPDVLLLDLVRPGLCLAEFVRWARAHCPATEVLPLMVRDRDGYLAWMVEAGAAGFITKDEAAWNSSQPAVIVACAAPPSCVRCLMPLEGQVLTLPIVTCWT